MGIEKLVTPIEALLTTEDISSFMDEVREKEEAFNEMLEALYPFVKTHSHSDFINEGHCDCMGCTGRRAIESACPGKSWEEIKAAYDE